MSNSLHSRPRVAWGSLERQLRNFNTYEQGSGFPSRTPGRDGVLDNQPQLR